MEKYKKSCKYNKSKISVPTWNEEFELPDESYSASDIQDYFKYTFKKHKTVTDNPSIMINVNKIENRITFKRKTGYYLELLTPVNTENKIMKHKNGENVPHLEITEVLLIHCNIVNNDDQPDSRVLHTFVLN